MLCLPAKPTWKCVWGLAVKVEEVTVLWEAE